MQRVVALEVSMCSVAADVAAVQLEQRANYLVATGVAVLAAQNIAK